MVGMTLSATEVDRLSKVIWQYVLSPKIRLPTHFFVILIVSLLYRGIREHATILSVLVNLRYWDRHRGGFEWGGRHLAHCLSHVNRTPSPRRFWPIRAGSN